MTSFQIKLLLTGIKFWFDSQEVGVTGSPSSISSTNEYLLLSSESGTVAVLKVTEEGVKVQAEVANADTSCLFMADDSPVLATLSSKKVASDMTYARENVQCTWRLILYICLSPAFSDRRDHRKNKRFTDADGAGRSSRQANTCNVYN